MSPIYRKTAAKAWEMAWKKWNTNFRENRTTGAFDSTKTSGLNFQQLPVANGTAFSKISKKEENLASYTIRGIGLLYEVYFFPKVFFPFNIAPGVFRLSGSHFGNSTFLETFPGNFCTIWRCFQIFESFGWMESALESTMFHFSGEVLLQKYRSSETGARSMWCSTAYYEYRACMLINLSWKQGHAFYSKVGATICPYFGNEKLHSTMADHGTLNALFCLNISPYMATSDSKPTGKAQSKNMNVILFIWQPLSP